MNTREQRSDGTRLAWLPVFAQWILGPVLVLLGAAALGQACSSQRPGAFFAEPALVTEAREGELRAAVARSLANVVWALGDESAVRRMTRAELDRLGEDAPGPERARVYLRFGLIDTNPDGQAAVFSQACLADPKACDDLATAALTETRARLVRPGNTLPLSLIGGHPPIE